MGKISQSLPSPSVCDWYDEFKNKQKREWYDNNPAKRVDERARSAIALVNKMGGQIVFPDPLSVSKWRDAEIKATEARIAQKREDERRAIQ